MQAGITESERERFLTGEKEMRDVGRKKAGYPPQQRNRAASELADKARQLEHSRAPHSNLSDADSE